MPIYDELYKFQDKLNHVLTRHEQGATHVEQGFSSFRKVGVVMATSGPGATNLITELQMLKLILHPGFVSLAVASHLLVLTHFKKLILAYQPCN